jgi:hypothetical protein
MNAFAASRQFMPAGAPKGRKGTKKTAIQQADCEIAKGMWRFAV